MAKHFQVNYCKVDENDDKLRNWNFQWSEETNIIYFKQHFKNKGFSGSHKFFNPTTVNDPTYYTLSVLLYTVWTIISFLSITVL